MNLQGNVSIHADRELRLAGYDPDSPEFVKSTVYRNVMDLMHTFEDQRHSGMSAKWIMSFFQRLADFQPLGPLTGDESEWQRVEEGRDKWQNVRSGRVFREDGQAYDSEGRVFRTAEGMMYVTPDSRVPVTFPYTPTTEVVNVDGE